MSRRPIAIAIAASISLGCSVDPLPPEGQVLLYLDTDAWLPDPRDPDRDHPPLFDRLRIELFEPGATEPCAGCTREFGVDHTTVFAGEASVGIVPRPGERGYRARVRLYRVGGADLVDPRPTSTLEAVVRLPVVQTEGIVETHIVLRTDELGAPQGSLDAPIDPSAGRAPGGLAGTWAKDTRRDCGGAPAAGEVCVRGGAYWMGDLTIGDAYGDTLSERLVVVSPFYLGASEVTVADWRASGMAVSGNLFPHSASHPLCTYTTAAGDSEQHPVNCVTREAAEAYCAARGARLPTEGEWEYVASARRSAHAVWGDDPARCEDAIFGRNGDFGVPPATKECLASGKGPAAAGSGARDRLAIGGGAIVDLAGNLSEWMADAWAEEGEPCWSGPILRDPRCQSGSAPPGYLIRGASFEHAGSNLRAALRARVDADGKPLSVIIGFRCARGG